MADSSGLRTSTLIAVSAGTVITGILAYAVYFDHKRRNDPDFRRSLKRESKRQAKAAKAEQEAANASQKQEISRAVRAMNAEGYPTNPEEREALFLENMQKGEGYIQDGDVMEAAKCLFRCLKLYPAKGDLIKMFDQTVPKDILDVLAAMVASDPSMNEDDIDVA